MLDYLPYEVLETIAFWAANSPTQGCWPSPLPALFSLNSNIHDALLGAPYRGTPTNNALLARLFDQHFDSKAFERRCHVKLTSADRAAEYIKRIPLLRRIRQNLEGHYSIDDLWAVLLMVYEDDGKNMRQLLDAQVDQWAIRILREALLQLDEDGWPVESVAVQLSAAIYSLVCTTESVMPKTIDERLDIADLVHPFLFASHRYSTSHIPITHHFVNARRRYTAPRNSFLGIIGTLHIYSPNVVSHLGYSLTLASPRVVESALCITSLLMERSQIPISPLLPENRAAADARDIDGATQEDHRENNLHRSQALGSEVPHAGSTKEQQNLACLPNPLIGSMRFDIDFFRLAYAHDGLKMEDAIDKLIDKTWYNTVYIPGLLTGNWVGRLWVPQWDGFMRMFNTHPAPLPSVEGYDLVAIPMQATLREHIATDLVEHIGCGPRSKGDNVANGWFPTGIDPSRGLGAYQTPHELILTDASETMQEYALKHYTSYYDGMRMPRGMVRPPPQREGEQQSSPNLIPQIPEDVVQDFQDEHNRNGGQNMAEGSGYDPYVDVIVSGETDYRHGRAWGAYTMYGRVRKNDGLITLVRVPVNQEIGQGRWIFSGYLRASTTIVGQWRETGTDMDASGYAGPFMITKVGDTWGPPPPLPVGGVAP